MIAKMLISVHRRFMNLYVEKKADIDRAGKVKSWFGRICGHEINVFDHWFFWES